MMIFVYDTTTVTLDDPAQFPQTEGTELVQAKERSASGVTQAEDFSVRIGTYTYNFIDMSNDDYTALLGFFLNDAQGMLNEFDLTDDLGVTRTVRFTTPRLSFVNTAFGLGSLWGGNFTVEVVA